MESELSSAQHAERHATWWIRVCLGLCALSFLTPHWVPFVMEEGGPLPRPDPQWIFFWSYTGTISFLPLFAAVLAGAALFARTTRARALLLLPISAWMLVWALCAPPPPGAAPGENTSWILRAVAQWVGVLAVGLVPAMAHFMRKGRARVAGTWMAVGAAVALLAWGLLEPIGVPDVGEKGATDRLFQIVAGAFLVLALLVGSTRSIQGASWVSTASRIGLCVPFLALVPRFQRLYAADNGLVMIHTAPPTAWIADTIRTGASFSAQVLAAALVILLFCDWRDPTENVSEAFE